jgi:hypothetical protein
MTIPLEPPLAMIPSVAPLGNDWVPGVVAVPPVPTAKLYTQAPKQGYTFELAVTLRKM